MRPTFVSSTLTLFVVSALMGTWASYDLALSLPMLLTLLGSVCLFIVIAHSTISPWWVGKGIVILASLLALYFVGQYAHFDYQYEVGHLANLGRMTGSVLPAMVLFIPHPNAVASFLEGALLLSLVLTWQTSANERLVWGLAAASMAYGLLISGSRGAWIGLALALGIWTLLLFPRQVLPLVRAGVGLTAGILLGVYALVPRVVFDQLPLVGSELDTVTSRLTLYRNSLYLLSDYPFTGIGLGDVFAMVYSRYQLLIHVPFLYYPHNLFLSVGLGQGLLGLVALVWLLVSFYRFVIRVERVSLDARSLPLFRAAWLGTTATIVHGLTDSPQFSGDRWTMPMFFALLGLAVALGRPILMSGANQEEINEVPVGWHRHRKWAVLAVVIVIFMAVVVVFRQPLTSTWYANLGAIHQTQAELSANLNDAIREANIASATSYFERALQLNPLQPIANRRLGMLALDREDFETATIYLERAYAQEPENQATLKLLGYVYLWTGRLDLAQERFQHLDQRSEVVSELKYWHWWWTKQNRRDLSVYADEMVWRLSGR